MLHVDEGALHAYLDGALDEYPLAQARSIRAHLERCERCAEALSDARRVREEAERILVAPDLDVVPPPFEELKRLARSSGTAERRVPPLAHRFGWAASVVLALGAGWMLRGEAVSVPLESVDRAAVPLAAESGMAGPSARDEGAALVRRPEAGGLASNGDRARDVVSQALPAAPGPMGAPVLEVAPVRVAGEDEARLSEVLAEPMVSLPPAPAALSPVDAEAATEAASLGPPPPPPVEVDGGANPSGTEAGVALSNRAYGTRDLEAFDRGVETKRGSDGGDQRNPGSLVVPGLEVLSIVWREEGVIPAGVRVLQRMTDGSELELFHLPEGFEPEFLAPAAAGVTELVVPRDRGWLVLRAAADETALRELLRRLDEAPPM